MALVVVGFTVSCGSSSSSLQGNNITPPLSLNPITTAIFELIASWESWRGKSISNLVSFSRLVISNLSYSWCKEKDVATQHGCKGLDAECPRKLDCAVIKTLIGISSDIYI